MKKFRTVLLVGLVCTIIAAAYFLIPNVWAGIRQDGWNFIKWVGGYALVASVVYGAAFGVNYLRLSPYKTVLYNTKYNTIHVLSLNQSPVKDWVRVNDKKYEKWESRSNTHNHGYLGTLIHLQDACSINRDDDLRLVMVFDCNNQRHMEKFAEVMTHYRDYREKANRNLHLVQTGGA
jgi:hypothetical protein